MDQTTQAGDITDTLETLERMAASATETPDLAAFLAETAALIRSLVDDRTESDRRLALYETP